MAMFLLIVFARFLGCTTYHVVAERGYSGEYQ